MSQLPISIIVPCYNQAQYLDECLQSVLDQTYQSWECIIVNDGSEDHTEEIANNWTKKDPRFIYYRKENGGAASARNFGIEKAQGEWILPLDGDDYLSLDLLKNFIDRKKDHIIFSYFATQNFGEISQTFPATTFSYEQLLMKNFLTCSCFYKKEDWKKIKGYDENTNNGFEDWEFYIRLLQNIRDEQILIIPDSYLFYRIRQKSRSSEIYSTANKKDISEKYIVQKNILLYQKMFPSFIHILNENRSLKEMTRNLENKNKIVSNIKRNKLTKCLYNLIEILNKKP